MRKYRLLCGLALIAACGCAKPVSQQDILGLYTISLPRVADTLEIAANGKYVHKYQRADGTAISNSDTWVFAIESGEPRITFSNFTFGPNAGSKVTGFWSVAPERSGSRIRLTIDDDLNQFYIK